MEGCQRAERPQERARSAIPSLVHDLGKNQEESRRLNSGPCHTIRSDLPTGTLCVASFVVASAVFPFLFACFFLCKLCCSLSRQYGEMMDSRTDELKNFCTRQITWALTSQKGLYQILKDVVSGVLTYPCSFSNDRISHAYLGIQFSKPELIKSHPRNPSIGTP